ncbi:hypothetical protein [Parasitella parasitica]|uniref:Sorting nexin-4 n=1 Tax=Parasitella parasitica TaxID=35722 RepID=A0A0B7MRY5_9FUNG|nr:hypothetical protein [Parasitella parasitica]
MQHTTEDQFNVQWDVLSDSHNGLPLDPLSELGHNEPAILPSQSYLSDSSHIEIDLDISDKQKTFSSDTSLHEDSMSEQSNSSAFYNQTHYSQQQQRQQPSPSPQFLNHKINVSEPRKETEQQSTFISYLVQSNKKQVRRRFQDFVWLHNVLYTHFPACFVPPLPDKHRLGETVLSESNDFIEKRRISLERFIRRLAGHPILGRAEFFIMFLESSEFNDASARALREGQETVIDSIGDSLLNTFSKIRKPDPRFVDMKERNERMEENLDMLQKTLLRTNKRTEDLCHDYGELTSSVRGLSDIESSYKAPLDVFAQGLDKYTCNLKTMTIEDSRWQIEVNDYMAYFHAIKDVLKLRDQKQLDFEDLSEYLRTTIEEREKIIRTGDGGGVAGFLAGKINEVRGADTDKIRREKVLKLDERVRELKDAIDQTHQISTAFSDQVKKEDVLFNRNKAVEMFDALKIYTDAKVNFYQDSVNVWRRVVQSLENNVDPSVL